MNSKVIKEIIVWGLKLWALGFFLGMIFFPFVPVKYIGIPVLFLIIPATYIATVKIFKEFKIEIKEVLAMSIFWTTIAVVLDYGFLVNAFKVQNYYDMDVIIYYALTFLIPCIYFFKKQNKKQ